MCRIVIYGCKNVKHISTKGAETLISCNINKQDVEVIKTNEITTEIKVCHGVLAQVHKLKFSGNTEDFNTKECYVQLESLCEQDIEDIIRPNESERESEMEEESIVVKVEPEESCVSEPMDDMYFVPKIKEERAESCPMDLLVDPVKDLSNGRIYECSYCSISFDKREKLKHHIKNHIKRQLLKCNECPETFLTVSAHTNHQKIHRNFQCKICGNFFQNKDSLRRHTSRHEKSTSKNFKCEHCDKAFERKDHAQRHMAIHTSNQQKRRHQARGTSEKLHECPMCDKKYSSLNHLQRHFKSHKGKNIKCEHCDKTFVRKDEAQRHTAVIHSVYHGDTNGKLHECSICHKKYFFLSELRRHCNGHKGKI